MIVQDQEIVQTQTIPSSHYACVVRVIHPIAGYDGAVPADAAFLMLGRIISFPSNVGITSKSQDLAWAHASWSGMYGYGTRSNRSGCLHHMSSEVRGASGSLGHRALGEHELLVELMWLSWSGRSSPSLKGPFTKIKIPGTHVWLSSRAFRCAYAHLLSTSTAFKGKEIVHLRVPSLWSVRPAAECSRVVERRLVDS